MKLKCWCCWVQKLKKNRIRPWMFKIIIWLNLNLEYSIIKSTHINNFEE